MKVCIYAKQILIFPTVTDSALINDDRLRVDYYKILPDLSAGASDAFTTTFFDATIYRTLMEGALFIQDEELFDFYKEFFRDQISNAYKATIDEKYSGRLLEMGGHR